MWFGHHRGHGGVKIADKLGLHVSIEECRISICC